MAGGAVRGTEPHFNYPGDPKNAGVNPPKTGRAGFGVNGVPVVGLTAGGGAAGGATSAHSATKKDEP